MGACCSQNPKTKKPNTEQMPVANVSTLDKRDEKPAVENLNP